MKDFYNTDLKLSALEKALESFGKFNDCREVEKLM